MAGQQQSPYKLQRNEVLYRAAQLSAQYGVDMAMLMNTPNGGAIKYASCGSAEATLRRLQELPTAEALTTDQVLRHHETGAMPLPSHGSGQWDMIGRQGAWLQLVAPSGQTVQLPALRPPGFLDRSQCPVSPRSEAAYASLTHELDRLCDLATAAKRRRLAEPGSGPLSDGLHATTGSGGGQTGGNTGDAAAKSSRFKALSVQVPHQTVVGARPAGPLTGQGPQTLEREAMMMNPESLVMPSPSGFLTSGPQSLGGMQFPMDLIVSARGTGPSPRNQDLLVAGQLGRLNDGAAGAAPAGSRGLSESGAGDLAELTTPNSSLAQLNGYMWSPHSSNATGSKNPGGFTDDPEEGEGGGPEVEVEGAADLMVQGHRLSKASLQALDAKAAQGQAGGSVEPGQDATAGAGPSTQQTPAGAEAGASGAGTAEEKGTAAGAEAAGATPAAAPANAIDIPIDI